MSSRCPLFLLSFLPLSSFLTTYSKMAPNPGFPTARLQAWASTSGHKKAFQSVNNYKCGTQSIYDIPNTYSELLLHSTPHVFTPSQINNQDCDS